MDTGFQNLCYITCMYRDLTTSIISQFPTVGLLHYQNISKELTGITKVGRSATRNLNVHSKRVNGGTCSHMNDPARQPPVSERRTCDGNREAD